jgi:hypothetical protein
VIFWWELLRALLTIVTAVLGVVLLFVKGG